jgi:hypothetical protein
MGNLQKRADAPELNALRRTAFGLLGATTRDGKREIGALADDKSLALDPEVCAKARQDLTTPRNRLAPEMAWLPGISPKRAEHYCALLDSDLDECLHASASEQPLVRANLLAAVVEMTRAETSEPVWADLILKLAKAADEVDTAAVLTILNEDRKVAGIADIQSAEAVDADFAERMRAFKDTVRAALNRMPTERMLDVMSRIVETGTDSGSRQAPVLVDDLLDSYGLDARPFLEKEAANITKLVEAVRNAAPHGGSALNTLFDKLEAVVRNWTKVARPIQISMKSRGMVHDLSRDTGFGIRSLAVDLYNEHDSLDDAKRLTALLKTHFSQFPELSERVDEDTQALHDIARKKAATEALAPLRSLCKEAVEAADANPSDGDRQGRKIAAGAPAFLSQAEHSDVSADILNGAKDEVAYAIVSCAIDFGNKTSKWRVCLELLQEAGRYAVGAEAREKIAKNLEIVQRNVRVYGDLTPIDSAPSLSTINGVGMALYGNTDPDRESGSYMATYYFVLFFIPIFPICRYRVISSGGNSYRFLGKGPLRTFDKWHIAISVGLIIWMFLHK